MTEHVAEVQEPKFTPTPITIDRNVLSLSDRDAFDWLLGKFVDYCQNKLIWIDVRSVLATAQERKLLRKPGVNNFDELDDDIKSILFEFWENELKETIE